MKCNHCQANTVPDEDGNCTLCGRPMTGPAPAVKTKEEPMVKNGIKAEDLNEETLVKLGAPMPPRPETAGMASAERMRALGHYYDANKDAILADFHELGSRPCSKSGVYLRKGGRYAGRGGCPRGSPRRNARAEPADLRRRRRFQRSPELPRRPLPPEPRRAVPLKASRT